MAHARNVAGLSDGQDTTMTPTATPDGIVVPLQLAGLEQQLSQVIGQILAFLPVVLSAIVVLVVGYVVGRLLEAVIVRILDSIELSDYTSDTARTLRRPGRGVRGRHRHARRLLRLLPNDRHGGEHPPDRHALTVTESVRRVPPDAYRRARSADRRYSHRRFRRRLSQ